MRVVFSLLGAIVAMLSARTLSVEELGSLMLVITTISIIIRISSIGLGPAAQFFGAKELNRDEEWSFPLGVAISASIVLSIISILSFDSLLNIIIFSKNPLAEELYGILKYGIPLLLLHFLVSLFFLGKRRLVVYSILTAIPVIFTIAVFLLHFLFKTSIEVAVWAWYAQFLSGGVIGLIFAFRYVTLYYSEFSKKIHEIFTYSINSYLVSLVGFISLRFAMVFSASYASAEDIGLFYIGRFFSETLMVVYGAIGVLIFSYIAEDKNHIRAQKLFERVSRISFVLFLAIIALIVLVVPLLLPIMFGDKYTDSIVIVFALLPGVVLIIQQRMLENYLYGKKKQLNIIYVHIVSIISLAILIPIFINQFGIIGIALASSVTSLFTFAIMVFLAYKLENLKPINYLIPTKMDIKLILLFIRKRLTRGQF